MLRPLSIALFAFPLLAQGWVDRTPANPTSGPQARAFPAVCWDAARNQVLMFGGLGTFGAGLQDTWVWNGSTWTRRITPTLPQFPQRRAPCQFAMTSHAGGDVVLLVEGNTYTWDGSDWLYRQTLPMNGFGYPCNLAIGHDSSRNQTVLFVGSRWENQATDVAETYVWDGFAWSQRITPVLPYPCQYPSMAFDPVANRLLLTTSGNGQSAYFEWTGGNWQQRLIAGTPASSGALASDTGNNRVVMLDGVMQTSPGHTWTFANGVCTAVASALEPARRLGAGMTYDPVRSRVVMFGGATFWSPNVNPLVLALGDTWEFTLGAGAAYSTFGTGCAGSRGVVSLNAQGNSLPRIGQTFDLHIGNLPFQGPVFLFLGISNTNYGPTPLPFSLAGLGAPSCSVLASGDELNVLTNVLGTAVWQRAMPAFPGLVFYNQAFALDPSANALGMTASNGGRATVGF
jgi:hypothetical protein